MDATCDWVVSTTLLLAFNQPLLSCYVNLRLHLAKKITVSVFQRSLDARNGGLFLPVCENVDERVQRDFFVFSDHMLIFEKRKLFAVPRTRTKYCMGLK